MRVQDRATYGSTSEMAQKGAEKGSRRKNLFNAFNGIIILLINKRTQKFPRCAIWSAAGISISFIDARTPKKGRPDPFCSQASVSGESNRTRHFAITRSDIIWKPPVGLSLSHQEQNLNQKLIFQSWAAARSWIGCWTESSLPCSGNWNELIWP